MGKQRRNIDATVTDTAVRSSRVRWLSMASVMFAVVASAVPASAAGPTLNWNFSSSAITAGTRPGVSYVEHGAPSGSRLVVQRTFGTAAVWKTVKAVDLDSSGSGSAVLPAVPMGQYRYRLEIKNVQGAVVRVAQSRTLRSFANVPLGQLLGQAPRSVAVAQHTFNYVDAPDLEWFYMYPDGVTLLHSTSSVCRSLHIDVAVSTDQFFAESKYGVPDSFEVLQETADPVSVNVPTNAIASLDAPLSVGHSWSLNGSGSYVDYINGYASCYSLDALS